MPTMKWIIDHIDSLYIDGNEICCVNCQYFYQHYIVSRINGKSIPTNCGHCTATQRIKSRKAYDRCEHFKPQE